MDSAQTGRTLLVALASEIEARACGVGALEVWRELEIEVGLSVVLTGVGKAGAAGGTASVIDPRRHGLVVSLGIAGSLPGCGLGIGGALVAARSVFADDGIETPDGYQSCAEMGFPPFDSGDAIGGDPEVVGRLVREGLGTGTVATVSTCSGTDARAGEIVRRTGALVEAMEGAAVGLVALRRGVRFAEVRVVSNTTGDRGRQRWDMPAALERLGEVFGMLSDLRA